MNPKSLEARIRNDDPFQGLHIADTKSICDISVRSACPSCGKSRMYFCYTCFVLVSDLKDSVPLCKLPVKVDIIKHEREIDGKSTAAHAAVLAPDDVRIYKYPNVPNYETDGSTVLIYPGVTSVSVQELFTGKKSSTTYSEKLLSELPNGYNIGNVRKKLMNNDAEDLIIQHVDKLPIHRVVLIDSTWNQSRGIYADDRLHNLPKIVLQNRISQFWRHQKGSPRWYLATIEALHQLLLELHICAWGRHKNYLSHLTSDYPIHTEDIHPQCKPYNGEYDNLLYFFKFMYEKLHKLYKHEDLLAYKRPMN